MLPLPSSAVMVMLCVVPSPDAISVPAIGIWVISYRGIAVIGRYCFCHKVGYCDLATAV